MSVFMCIGAGLGIGSATAERFAKEGFHIVLSGRNTKRLHIMAEDFKAKSYQVDILQLDASDPYVVREQINSTYQKFGSLDVLHYNAATMRQATIEEQELDSFIPDLATNIGGGLAAIQTAEKIMNIQGSGSILLTGGVFSIHPDPNYLSLGVGKAALLNINHALFEPFKAKNIHIATVTVAALVESGSDASKKIADIFWKHHTSKKEEWVADILYRE